MALYISETLVKDLLAYIEDRETTIDNEWGSCRSAKQIISDGDMPAIYKRVLNLRKKRGVAIPGRNVGKRTRRKN